MTNEELAAKLAAKWRQNLIRQENCSSTEEAIERACVEIAELKDKKLAKENKWIDVSEELPKFVATEDGSKYSNSVLCKDEYDNYCVARFARWRTGHYMWIDNHDEMINVKFWKELKK